MGLLQKLRTKAVTVIRRALSLVDPTTWPDGGQSESGENVSPERLLGLSTAWACVNLQAGTIGSLPAIVYQRQSDGSRRRAPDHWLYRLIHDSPNADQTALDFWEFMQACLELRGNAYAYAPRARDGRVIAMEPVPADFVEVRREEDGSLSYSYPGPKGSTVKRKQSEMLHIRGFGGGPLGGLSTIAFGRHSFGLSIAIDRSASAFFKKGLRSWGALKFDEWLKPNQRAEVREVLEREHMGASNSGKPLILEGGVEWQQMGFSPEDSQMLQSRAFSVEEVCRWFGTPPVLIGHTEKVSAWGSGIVEIILGFVKFGLSRRVKRIEQALAKQLLTPEDRAAGYYVEFALEGLLRGAPKERSEFYRTMTQAGIMSINECRALENLEGVPGGEAPRLQMQNVPLAAAIGSTPLLTQPSE